MTPEGSVWRKWDFHIHTPASYLWEGGRQLREMTREEKDAACVRIVARMNAADAAAFVVMDYWTFDGYLALTEFLNRRRDVRLEKALFPGMELRVEAPTSIRLNIHVLLSNLVTPQQLQDFKAALQIPLIERPLSDESLAATASKVPPDIILRHGHKSTDLLTPEGRLTIGQKLAVVSRDSLFAAVEAVPDGQALLFLPFDTYHGVRDIQWREHPLLTTDFMTRAHILEIRQRAAGDACQGVCTPENKAFAANFLQTLGGRPKPAVSGSDAHHPDKYAVFPNDQTGAERGTWIKAEPTFRGLRQILTEPAGRVFVGPLPPKLALVRDNPTKYIRSLSIRKKPDSDLVEEWFDADLRFNHDLVAIIGNRGNGKSALADIISLLGRSKNAAHFSFLNKDKFRHPKLNKGRHFTASLTWKDGEVVEMGLDENPSPASVERVRYLPQNYLDTICNEIKFKTGEGFDSELKSVIFSHVPAPARLGKASLDDLIAVRSRETDHTIGILKGHLHDLNVQIVQAEHRTTSGHKSSLEERLRLKTQELVAHDARRPAEVPVPAADPSADAASGEEMGRLRGTIAGLDAAISAAKGEESTLNLRLADVTSAEGQLDNFERVFRDLLSELTVPLTALGVPAGDLVRVTIDRSQLVAKRGALNTELTAAKRLLDETAADGLGSRRRTAAAQLSRLQAALDGPTKAHQAYLTALAAWDVGRVAIVGAADVQNTIEYLNAQIAELATLPALLEDLRDKRRAKAREIYAEIDRLAGVYREVYKPVQEFSGRHPLINERFGLNFSVAIRPVPGLTDIFFSLVARNVAGSFCGTEEGEQVLRGLLDKQDFSTADGAVAFAEELLGHLTHDRRDGRNAPMSVGKQLRKQQTPEALYDFVFSLGFLAPEYDLNLGQKALPQLSPGERGMLLLMFYLLIDKDDTPLVIDQPEGNLDNETVYLLLGACIKEAKKRRQIIIVTHNPNLAVACDAEQVICAQMDQANGNRVRYVSGSIESPEINRLLMNILEGTRPAFDNRGAKYFETATVPAPAASPQPTVVVEKKPPGEPRPFA